MSENNDAGDVAVELNYAQELVKRCLTQLLEVMKWAAINRGTLGEMVEEEVTRLEFPKPEDKVPEKKREDVVAVVTVAFEIGARVDGKFEINGRDRWYAGVVLGVYAGCEKYDVLYDDGDYGQGTTGDCVRKSKNKRSLPEVSVEAIEAAKKGAKHEKHVDEVEGGLGEEEEELEISVADSLADVSTTSDRDQLEESDGIFMSIPSTLPLKPKEATEARGGALTKSLSLGNLRVGRSFMVGGKSAGGGDAKGAGGQTWSKGFNEENKLLMVGLFARVVAASKTSSIEKLKVVLSRAKGLDIPADEATKTLLKILRPISADLEESLKKQSGGELLGTGRFGVVKNVAGQAWKVIDCSSAIVDVKAVVAEIEALKAMASNEHVLEMFGYGR